MQFRAVYPEKPLSRAERFCGLAMCLLKGSIVAGLIYWTYTEGFWGDSTETEDLYYRIMSTIFPTDGSVNKHRAFFFLKLQRPATSLSRVLRYFLPAGTAAASGGNKILDVRSVQSHAGEIHGYYRRCTVGDASKAARSLIPVRRNRRNERSAREAHLHRGDRRELGADMISQIVSIFKILHCHGSYYGIFLEKLPRTKLL